VGVILAIPERAVWESFGYLTAEPDGSRSGARGFPLTTIAPTPAIAAKLLHCQIWLKQWW